MAAVFKSYQQGIDPVSSYCCRFTVKQNHLQEELQKHTLELENSIMLGAPEVLSVGENFIKLINGKKILDIGTFTGASALAWAITIPSDGEVLTLDIDHSTFKKHGVPIIGKCPQLLRRIVPIEGSALESMDALIEDGQAETFDFIFIDADKESYPDYYERSVRLLRKGGVILIDNALKEGQVTNYSPDNTIVKAIDDMNKLIYSDPRTASFLVNCGDGIHVAFKL